MSADPVNVGVALRWAFTRLVGNSGTPGLDAEVLLADALSKGRAWLRAHDDAMLEPSVQATFTKNVIRRADGEPVAYLLGRQEFWSLSLRVSSHTLIPRPETELLVETVLRMAPASGSCEVLDLGTGTGAIALALKHERPSWQVCAVDCIPEAVALAAQNAQALGLSVKCFVSDWYRALLDKRFHVIVSNPPYIDANDAHLYGDGVRHEPLTALVADDEGLADLRAIIAGAPAHLLPGGLLAVEHGWSQGKIVSTLFIQAGFDAVQTLEDLSGQPRVTLGFWHL